MVRHDDDDDEYSLKANEYAKLKTFYTYYHDAKKLNFMYLPNQPARAG